MNKEIKEEVTKLIEDYPKVKEFLNYAMMDEIQTMSEIFSLLNIHNGKMSLNDLEIIGECI